MNQSYTTNGHKANRRPPTGLTPQLSASLAFRLAGWKPTPVATVTREQIDAALAAGFPAWPILAAVELIMTGLCADYQLDPQAARQAFGCDVLAALLVAVHRRSHAYLTEQVSRIRYFLSQHPVRNRLTWRPKPLIDIDQYKPLMSIHGDGTITYRWSE